LKKLLTGNEAVAEGVIESGIEVVCGCPGICLKLQASA